MAERGRAGGSRTGHELVFVSLGGIGEIGMNSYLYGLGPEDERQWLMVDLGITFPEGENDPGVDVILPDLRFIVEERASLAGLVLTHAHEDHLGAVIELWPQLKVPIYATPFTAALLKAKLAEFGASLRLPITEVALGARFDVGPFGVELISMAHSIPESNALAIRTPLGLVLHSGDWKLDATPLLGAATDQDRLIALGEEGVAALIWISPTRFGRDAPPPRNPHVARTLARIIKDAKRAVAVTIFASNVSRNRAVADAARRRAVILWSRGGRCIASSRWRWRRATFPRTSNITTRSTTRIWTRMRSWCCARAARASPARRSPASPRIPTLR